MVDNRTNFAKDISFILRRDYGDKLLIFQTEIPLSIRAAETSARGKSIYAYDAHGLAAKAYEAFMKEVRDIGGKQRKRQQIFSALSLYRHCPVSLASFAGEPSQSIGKAFPQKLCHRTLGGAIIVQICLIFTAFIGEEPTITETAWLLRYMSMLRNSV
jgi:hypothetical protein